MEFCNNLTRKEKMSKMMMAVAGLAMAVAMSGCGGSPKGVAEDFVNAIIRGDTEKALKYLDPDDDDVTSSDLKEMREELFKGLFKNREKAINGGLEAEAFSEEIVRHGNGVRYREVIERRVNGDRYYEKIEERRVKYNYNNDEGLPYDKATVKVLFKQGKDILSESVYLRLGLYKIDGSWKVNYFNQSIERFENHRE